jgi:hypothetical protein
VGVGILRGNNFHRGIVRVEKGFSMEGEPDFSALFENYQKLNFKKHIFLTKSKEQYQNFKRTEIINYMRGLPFSQYLALYAKV